MADALYEKAKTVLRDSQMALASTEIANVFAAHTYYVRGCAEREDLERLWSKRDDIAYVADGKGYRGREAVEAYFVTYKEAQRREKLPMAASMSGGTIKDSEEYLGAGDYEMHWLTTPYIRVANDLQTAKGAWWSPGIVSELDEDGTLSAYCITINYGCDFILEDGAWKIWHLREFAEFSYAFDRDFLDMTGKEGGAQRELGRRIAAGAPESNIKKQGFGVYTKTSVPTMLPDVVAPFETWDDSMSCIRDCSGGAV